jgi:hypothetical protein
MPAVSPRSRVSSARRAQYASRIGDHFGTDPCDIRVPDSEHLGYHSLVGSDAVASLMKADANRRIASHNPDDDFRRSFGYSVCQPVPDGNCARL